jgi:hypothetical protein
MRVGAASGSEQTDSNAEIYVGQSKREVLALSALILVQLSSAAV